MSRVRRTIRIRGIKHTLSPLRALQLEVVRGALTGALTIERGAKRLKVPPSELQRLVEGARRAVIATLGEGALASQPGIGNH